MSNKEKDENLFLQVADMLVKGELHAKWSMWSFSGGHTDMDCQVFDTYELDENGQIVDEGFAVVRIAPDLSSAEMYMSDGTYYHMDNGLKISRLQFAMYKAIRRDDEEIAAMVEGKDGSLKFPTDYSDIRRDSVLSKRTVETVLPSGDDVVTVTRWGYDDYDIYYHNGDSSVRGSAHDILMEFTDNKLDQIKKFAEKNFASESPKTVTAKYGVALSDPWMDESARFPLDDAGALHEWGINAVLAFCLMAYQKGTKADLVPLVTTYSFDPEVSVRLYSTEQEAVDMLRKLYKEEYRIELEENNRTLGEDFDAEIAQDGTYAKIVIHGETDDVTEWAIGTIYE